MYLGQLAANWRDTLTQAQRDAWESYAANTPTTDAFGDELLLTGQQMYIRCNTPRLRAGAARIDDGPTTAGLAEYFAGGSGAVASTNTLSVVYDNTEPWANADEGILIVQTSMIKAPTINFLKAPMRFAGSVAGDATTAPTSPLAITGNAFGEAYTGRAGDVVFIRTLVSDGEGRLSQPNTQRLVIL